MTTPILFGIVVAIGSDVRDPELPGTVVAGTVVAGVDFSQTIPSLSLSSFLFAL